VALNPTRTDRRLGSFKINIRTGRWADFATGDKGGDPISLVAYLEGVSQAEAARRLARMLGLDTREAGIMDEFDDRFEPLTESECAAAQAGDDAPKDEGECIMLVPANAPPMPSEHPKLGKPSGRWPYRDAAGRLLFEVWRFDPAGARHSSLCHSGAMLRARCAGVGKAFSRQGPSMAWTGLRPLLARLWLFAKAKKRLIRRR
jgi:putative DNA primase/helicase